jgi:hypothetical protein
MKPKKRYFILLIPVLFFSFHVPYDIKPARLLQQMNDSIKNIQTLRLNISALERDGSSFRSANSEIKLQMNPRRLYFKNPSAKIEILYNAGKLNNKALVKTNTFPYVTIALDPRGPLMRKNQHYTIHEIGFEPVGKAVILTLAKDKEGLSNFKYHGKTIKNGHPCYLLEYENKNFGYVDYKAGENETIVIIAAKLSVNEYLVRFKNNLLNHYDYIKKGSIIKVPTLFCRKATLYIEEKSMLPVSATLSDDAGIFENYEFSKVEVNKPIKDEEFARDYKDYHF